MDYAFTELSKTVLIPWFDRLLKEEILPLWYKNSRTEEGFFISCLDREWKKTEPCKGTLVTQSRLIFNFAKGYMLTGDTRYKDAAISGARFLIDAFFDRKYGGFYWACTEDGSVVKDEKNSYGHAFVILGLSSAYEATGIDEFLSTAQSTAELVDTRFADGIGGLSSRTSRDFSIRYDEIKSFNPMLHYFEALLELSSSVTINPLLPKLLRLADFVFDSLVQKSHGLIPEQFDCNWQPFTDEKKGICSTGHAIEWGYFVSKAIDRGFPASYRDRAVSVFNAGLKTGYDEEAGGLISPVSYTGIAASPKKGCWEQSELLRGLIYFAVQSGEPRLFNAIRKTIGFVEKYFKDTEYGGWYFDPFITDEKGKHKGHIWKLDYHIVGMCLEALTSLPS